MKHSPNSEVLEEVEQLPRVFLHKIEGANEPMRLSDPYPESHPDEILNFYSLMYPILTTAKVSGPVHKNDELVYEFISVLGTKG